MPFMPSLAPAPLTQSKSDDTLAMSTRARSKTTRTHWESNSIYFRGFIPTHSAPTPVGHVITAYEHPMTIDVIRTLFSPEARPFTPPGSVTQ